MVSAFASRLNHSLASLAIPPGISRTIRSDETKLAGLQLPAGLDAGVAAKIRALVSQAFVFGFRVVMLICAGLAMTSATFAWLMIPAKLRR
jgi:hypothetical protein